MPQCRYRRIFTAAVLAFTMISSVCLFPELSYAADQTTLDQKKQQVSNIADQKASLESTLSTLNDELSSISSDMESIQSQISDKNDDIRQTESELDDARADEANQYNNMKLRIKYSYENGSFSYLAAILESENIGELMNRADEVSQLNTYDRNMLNEYVATKNTIAAKEDQLVADRESLTSLQSDLASKQTAASSQIAATSASISQFSDQLTAAEADAESYEAQLNEEKAAQAAAVKSVSYSSSASVSGDYSYDAPAITVTDSDTNMLAAIIYCEAGNQSYDGQVAVGSVVMNRVRSSRFPSTISGVIYQSGQFSPVASGRFAMVLASGAYAYCIPAAQDALSGTDITGGALFFCRDNGTIDGLVIGAHVFY